MDLLLQLVVAGVWASTLIMNVRRLYRLACVAQLRRWEEPVRLRSGLSRMWWWLGQREYWDAVRLDSAHALQISLLIFLFVWRMAS